MTPTPLTPNDLAQEIRDTIAMVHLGKLSSAEALTMIRILCDQVLAAP